MSFNFDEVDHLGGAVRRRASIRRPLIIVRPPNARAEFHRSPALPHDDVVPNS